MSSGIRSPAQAVCLWIWSPCPPPCPVSRGHRVDVVLLAQHPTPTFWMPWLIPLTWFMFSYDLFFFFNFTILYCFCHISTWIHHRNTCVPHPEPSSLPVPSLWVVPVHQPQASSTVHRTWSCSQPQFIELWMCPWFIDLWLLSPNGFDLEISKKSGLF